MNSIRYLLGLAIVLAVPALQAHGPIPRIPEAVDIDTRFFIADSATGEIVVLDLPSGEVLTRLNTPPYVISLGITPNGRQVLAMRGRNTDRDTISIIDTGIDGSGKARFPTVARTFTGQAPGGVRDGVVPTAGGRTTVLNEESAEMLILGSDEFGSLAAIPNRIVKLAAPDHYHYLEAGDYLYVGHLAKGFVQILERESGQEVARIGKCPVLHGMAKDEKSGRLFFACMADVVVVGTKGAETNQEVARIPYPDKQRIGIFYPGRDGVLWGSTEGATPAILRLDPSKRSYKFKSIPVDSAIQRGTSDDGRYLLLYSRNGTLEIRDGRSGKLKHKVAISGTFESEYHEHVDKALLPDIVTVGEKAYVTIPPEGVLVEVDMRSGQVLRRFELGGEPTRLVVVSAGEAAE